MENIADADVLPFSIDEMMSPLRSSDTPSTKRELDEKEKEKAGSAHRELMGSGYKEREGGSGHSSINRTLQWLGLRKTEHTVYGK